MDIISFDNDKLALIVRGKINDKHEPGLMDQHADCILGNGAPIGFFGNEGAASGGDSSVSLNSIGMDMYGVVYEYGDYLRKRPFYVDVDMATKYHVPSTVLIFNATSDEVTKFKAYWSRLKANPGSFNLLGGNCSTHASASFLAAGILKEGIPGLDTPDNLYRQLKKAKPSANFYSGYIGFTKRGTSDKFDLVVRAYIK